MKHVDLKHIMPRIIIRKYKIQKYRLDRNRFRRFSQIENFSRDLHLKNIYFSINRKWVF